MGAGWRRFTEKVKTVTPLTGRNFTRTSNARNQAMIKEADHFATHLKACLRGILRMQDATDDLLTTAKTAMASPLPHVWEETATAAGGAARPMTSIGGPGYRPDVLAPLPQQLSQSLEGQVLVPLRRWLDIFGALQQRLKEVDALRLEVDSRRRTVEDLTGQADGMREKMAKAGGADVKAEAALADVLKKMAHKEGKLQLVSQTYDQQEQQLHDDLASLITDAQWLSHYVAATFQLTGKLLMGAASAFDATRPGPTETAAGGSPSGTPSSRIASPVATPSPSTNGRGSSASGVRSSLSPTTPAPDSNPFVGSRPSSAART